MIKTLDNILKNKDLRRIFQYYAIRVITLVTTTYVYYKIGDGPFAAFLYGLIAQEAAGQIYKKYVLNRKYKAPVV